MAATAHEEKNAEVRQKIESDFDADLNALLGEDAPEGVDEAEEEEEGQETAPETPEQQAAAQQAFIDSLDAVLPELEDIPPSLRKKTLRDLLEDRKAAISQRDQIGFTKNQLQAKVDVLTSLVNQFRPADTPPTPVAPRPVPVQVDPTKMWNDPAGYGQQIVAAAQAAPLSEIERVRAESAQTKAQLDELMTERRDAAIRSAYQSGRPSSVTEELWTKGQAVLTSYIVANQLNPLDRESWKSAGDYLASLVPVAAAPAAPVARAAAPAPPVGGAPRSAAASTPTAAKNRNRLANHHRQQIADLKSVFGLSDEQADRVAAEVLTDPKTKGLF